jgi:ribosomal protein S18 acetylase RimI-like enzyme
MQLTSPGYWSQLIFTDFDGASYDRGDHFALHSLTNPTFFWGNLLIFENAPTADDFEKWLKLFAKEFTNPAIYHRTFAWQSPEIGDIRKFTENGFKLETTSVLTANKVVKPTKHNPKLKIRKLRDDKDWNDLLEVDVSCAPDHLPRAEWIQFHRNQARRYRAMEAAGLGHWYGGFIDGTLVTGLGLFHKDGLARFQNVSTHIDHQRRGYCQTLVYEVSKQALESGRANTLVMCADPDYHAIKIYESVGFVRKALEHGVSWFDPARAGRG